MVNKYRDKVILAQHKSDVNCLGNWRIMKKPKHGNFLEIECDKCGRGIVIADYIEGRDLPEELQLENIDRSLLE